MTAPSAPDPPPAAAAAQARELLARAGTVSPGTARDRHLHALGLLGCGVVMAGVTTVGVLLDGPWSILGAAGTWIAAVALILWIGRLTQRTSSSTPRGMTRASKVASWISFAVLVVGREGLVAVSDDAAPSPAAVLLLGVAVLLPMAAVAHRIWWDAWIPWRLR